MNKKLPIFATAGAAMEAYVLYNAYKTAPADRKAQGTLQNLTGMDVYGNNFSWRKTLLSVAPAALGIGASMVFSKLGGNRYISSIPWIKF